MRLLSLLGIGLLLAASTCKDRDPNPASGADFVEFRLNDTLTRFALADAGSTAKTLLDPPFYPGGPYLFAFRFYRGTQSFYLGQYSLSPLHTGRYTWTPSALFESANVHYWPKGEGAGHFENVGDNAIGYVNFTRLDTAIGGTIEGTFALDSIYYYPNDSTPEVSHTNRITEGRFRITRQ